MIPLPMWYNSYAHPRGISKWLVLTPEIRLVTLNYARLAQGLLSRGYEMDLRARSGYHEVLS